MNYERIRTFKQFVTSLADQSKCEERNVAAIITDKALTQVHSIGLNGGPKGLSNCLCVVDGKYGCLHAEINCLIKNRYDAPDKVMFVTLAPCKQCAAAIINAGFSTVYYIEEWKQDYGLRMLRAAGIQAVKI